MVNLLLYHAAFERVRASLDPRVLPLIMADDGTCVANGAPIDLAQYAPEIAWANRDLYTDGPVRDFMVSCLKSPQLKWLQSSAAGFEHPVFGRLVGNGVMLTNASASAVPIAEFVMAQVLAEFHPILERRDAQARAQWTTFPFRDVAGSTWLIFGLGHIGGEVAKRARAFGAHVIGARRQPRGNEPVDEMIETANVREHVARADVVVMTAALNSDTEHVVDEAFVRAFRPHAVFVNIGRGGLVDEGALLAGLARGQPDRAILDVFEVEPLPGDSALWSHPNVRVTAHCAGASAGTTVRGDEIFIDNLARYLNGEPLEMQVTDLR